MVQRQLRPEFHLESDLPSDMWIVAIQKRAMSTIDALPKERNDQEPPSQWQQPTHPRRA